MNISYSESEPEPAPVSLESAHFTRSRSRSRSPSNILLGVAGGAGTVKTSWSRLSSGARVEFPIQLVGRLPHQLWLLPHQLHGLPHQFLIEFGAFRLHNDHVDPTLYHGTRFQGLPTLKQIISPCLHSNHRPISRLPHQLYQRNSTHALVYRGSWCKNVALV